MIARGDGDGEVSGLGALKELIAELEVRRAKVQDGADRDALAGLFREQEREVPAAVTPSSFLYMRTLPIDLGDRPLGPGRHWHSPDLTLTPAGGGLPPTTDLVAGETYVISCTLRNRGDLRVPRAQVELFLTDPTLGFDTRRAISLTKAAPLSASVPAFGGVTVQASYTVPRGESGHKCLFARTYSFLPHEIPVDLYRLDPRMDRRIAQQNLMIAAAGQAFSFQVVHPLRAETAVRVRPLTLDEAGELPEVAARDLSLLDGREFPAEEFLERMEPQGSDAPGLDVDRGDGALLLRSEGDAPSPGARHEVEAEMRAAAARFAAGEGDAATFDEVLGAYRRSRDAVAVTRISLELPHFGLHPGQAITYEIVSEEARIGNGPTGGLIIVLAGAR